MNSKRYRIGIDVGGTNTDAALLLGHEIISTCKAATTTDVTTGVVAAIKAVLDMSGVKGSDVSGVMIGTTHFLNALVERRGLHRVGILRLCGETSRALPPMTDWPDDLRTVVDGGSIFADGGCEFDGRAIAPLDPQSIREACRKWSDDGVSTIAISSVFSLVDPTMETEAAEIVADEIRGAQISLSHRIGQNGLLQRESATILNASLQPLGLQTIGAFRQAFTELNLNAELFLTQNDGTLMAADYALRFPVMTIASGPTNSMRGAAFLTGLRDAVVVDVGGTTTDVGVIVNGFPRTKGEGATIAGVRTNFRIPDVLSFGLGGGSRIKLDPEIQIGPDSVGYRLLQDAVCFGGSTLTATDIAVAAGRLKAEGDICNVSLPQTTIDATDALIKDQIESIIDRMKTSSDPVVAIFVGGGSALVECPLDGVSQFIRPDHFGSANAVGAAIAQVSGEMDIIVSLDTQTREDAIDKLIAGARSRAVDAGADETSLEIADINETPLTYLPGNAMRIVAKVVGELSR